MRLATALPTIRFLLCCTQELEAASKSLLVDTIGNLKIGEIQLTRYAPMMLHTGHPVQMPIYAGAS
jgi:hypothetical protein